MRRAIVALLAAVVVACGGGGSGGSSAPSTPATAVPRADLLYGYFGVVDNQLAETAAHANVVFTMDWGDWDSAQGRADIAQRTIAQLQEAQARGIRKAIVAVGFTVFDGHYAYRGVADLHAFLAQVDALGLRPMLVALYPVDEPETHAIGDVVLAQLYADVRGAANLPIAVIYGDHGTFPGAGAADWIGFDDYSRAAVSGGPALRPDQRRIVVPGGSAPWRNDPAPFDDFANAHADVVAIVAFAWFDQPSNAGIRSNGMAPAYCAVGVKVKGSGSC